MLRNYFTIALRTLRRQPTYAVLNVAGLAAGLACFLVIFLFVRDELRYDRFHEHADRIVRIVTVDSAGVNQTPMAMTPALAAPALREHVAAIEETVRFYPAPNAVLEREGTRFKEEQFYFTDPTVFGVFSFPLLKGDPATALTQPGSVVLTEATARRYFGDADPFGQSLQYDGSQTLTVTGVVADVPSYSHLQFDALASFATLGDTESNPWTHQGWTYLLLAPGATEVEARLQTAFERVLKSRWDIVGLQLKTEPLTRIHLYSEAFGGGRGGDPVTLATFGIVGLLILLIACANYMNLATARAARRAREVGVRKVLGAGRGQLARQFLTEALVTSLSAFVLALLLVDLTLPWLNALLDKSLSLPGLDAPGPWGALVGAVLLTGLVAGSYPAFFLSRYQPAGVLQRHGGSRGAAWVRRVLVTTQFAASLVLIIGAFVIHAQLDYTRTSALGFDREQVVTLPLYEARRQPLKQELLKQEGVLAVSLASGSPMNGAWQGAREVNGEVYNFHNLLADTDVARALGLTFIEGRDFDPNLPTDAEESVLVNETAARLLGGVGQEYHEFGVKRIIGVVRDFHTASFHTPIEPTVISVVPPFFSTVLVRLAPGTYEQTLANIAAVWHQFLPHRPFEYTFLDAEYDALYRSEQRLGRLFNLFTALAIFVACLGLFGLAAYAAEQRRKEVAVRKVLGASVPNLVALLSGDFARLVVVAFLIATPVAWVLVQRWLETFAYRIQPSWATYVGAGLLVLGIALLTISTQALRAANTNPVNALRHE